MKPTESQLAEYKDAACNWARERLADNNTVNLDLESTGLLREDPETEIAQNLRHRVRVGPDDLSTVVVGP